MTEQVEYRQCLTCGASYTGSHNSCTPHLLKRVETLEANNERYKNALREITDPTPWGSDTPDRDLRMYQSEIARETIENETFDTDRRVEELHKELQKAMIIIEHVATDGAEITPELQEAARKIINE